VTEPRCCCAGGIKTAGWLSPAAILALLPKCPACFAACFAVAANFGIQIHASAFARIRFAVIALCVMAVCYGTYRLVRTILTTVRLRQLKLATSTGSSNLDA
jgi:hypothetical protein